MYHNVKVKTTEGLEEEAKSHHKMIRHGYGLQMYNGSRNDDGVLTKYEGAWDRDRKHGQGVSIYADGSIYTGTFKKDQFEG